MLNVKRFLGIMIASFFLIAPNVTNAWTEPSAGAPTGNVSAPINVGSVNQSKNAAITATGFSTGGSVVVSGAVQVGDSYTGATTGDVKGKRLCIGSDCKSAWPGGISGGSSGSANYITKWTNATTIDNSNSIYESPTAPYNIGIGTTAPASKFDVKGIASVDGFSSSLNVVAAGSIQAGTLITASAGDVKGTRLCIGSDCRNAWPGGIAGANSGVTNYVAKWTGVNTIDNSSLIFDNGTNVGVGTATPSQKLDVNGKVKSSGLCLGTKCITDWSFGGGTCGLSERALYDYGCPQGSYLIKVAAVCGEGSCGNGTDSASCRYFDPSMASKDDCYGTGGASTLCGGKTAGTIVNGTPGACTSSAPAPGCNCGEVAGTQTVPQYKCDSSGKAIASGSITQSCLVYKCDNSMYDCNVCGPC